MSKDTITINNGDYIVAMRINNETYTLGTRKKKHLKDLFTSAENTLRKLKR